MIRVKEENIIFVKVDTFAGASVGAAHYYGSLKQLIGGRSAEVTHKLTQIEADRLNKCWLTKDMRASSAGYKKGECSSRFFSREVVIVAAKKQFKKCFSKATVLVLGSTGFAEPQEILVGPKEFKDKVNKLAKKYDKLNWDIEIDRPAIEKIEERWQKMWPRKDIEFRGSDEKSKTKIQNNDD